MGDPKKLYEPVRVTGEQLNVLQDALDEYTAALLTMAGVLDEIVDTNTLNRCIMQVRSNMREELNADKNETWADDAFHLITKKLLDIAKPKH